MKIDTNWFDFDLMAGQEQWAAVGKGGARYYLVKSQTEHYFSFNILIVTIIFIYSTSLLPLLIFV